MQTPQSETNEEKKIAKTQLRTMLLRRRRELASETSAAAATAIAAGVLSWWEARRPSSLGVYWPIRSEPDLRALYPALQARGVQLALPAVDGDHAPLRFLAWAPGEALQDDRFGVAVPAAQAEIQPAALLVPCVGFNPLCLRLGYGGGFYDRTLAAMHAQGRSPLTLGIAYDCSAAQFDGDAHDIALDAVLTESRLQNRL